MTEQPPSDPTPSNEALVAEGDAPDPRPESTVDAKRVVIPIVVLAVIALGATVVGVAGRRSADSANVTAGTTTTTVAPTGADRSSSTGEASPSTGAASPSTDATGAPPPECGQWPPSYFAPSADMSGTGAYLWAQEGWHLRIVSDRPMTVGAILSTATDLMPEAFTLTNPEAGRLEVRGNLMAFRLDADTTLKGIDFLMPCPIGEFTLRIQGADGQLWPVERISIGPAHKAVANPLVVTRLR